MCAWRSLIPSTSTGSIYLRRVTVTAKADYAVRAMLELAAVDDGLVKGERISRAGG